MAIASRNVGTENAGITAAIALIGEIDPSAARLFAAQPANRHTLVTAFHRSLTQSRTYGHLADEIAVGLRAAIDASKVPQS
ncbi:MAG TPA: hypothetical protein VGD45_20425 [Steroidobacter sp.]|uniref:hypothetical protein n=1 Tax=Steroidobacter sp. TaxID=1978227 RepID=UPI002ED94FE9